MKPIEKHPNFDPKTNSFIADPLPGIWETLDTNTNEGRLLIRRMPLEALGWRIHYEDDLLRSKCDGHYVYWVGPNGEKDSNWWAEGAYLPRADHHWYPPLIGLDYLLKGMDFEIKTVKYGDRLAWQVSVYNGQHTATDFDQYVAACCAVLLALHTSKRVDETSA